MHELLLLLGGYWQLLLLIGACVVLAFAVLTRATAVREVFALHSNVFAILKSDTFLAIRTFDAVDLRCDAALSADWLEQGHGLHVLLAPNAGTLPGHYLGQLKLSVVPLLVSQVNLLAHVLFEFLDAHIFGHRTCLVLLALRLLGRQPRKNFFVGVGFALLVCHVIAVA